MILLVYRIFENVPVIIMGDSSYGKTALITKLNQILNNGENTLKIINIYPGYTDENLWKKMREINEESRQNNGKELWVFFDEMNTCLSLSLLTEILINRTYNGNSFSYNIRLIGDCNPYRKVNNEKKELSISDDNYHKLVYLVQPLPQSLLYFIFSFDSIDNNDEKKYNIIEKLFAEDEKNLHEITRNVISQCHIYLRNIFDPSIVSLRKIARLYKCIEFFKEYFNIKNKYEKRINNKKNNKSRSIICSIYLCYYIKLTQQEKRFNFEAQLIPTLFKLINNDKSIGNENSNDIMKRKFQYY